MSKNVAMVLTSHDKLGDTNEKTGFWLEEFAAPYYAFLGAGVSVTIVSVAGGQPPLDPKSELEDFQTDATRRFAQDKDAQQALANTGLLSQLKAENFDGVFYPGGHGPLWDLTDNTDSIALIESTLASNKPVAAVCHASCVLLKAKDENGQPLVKGKAVTGFTNTEEDAVQLTNIVPFLLEEELNALGGDYQKVEDWHPFAVQDGLLITGQNPASSLLAAQKLIASL